MGEEEKTQEAFGADQSSAGAGESTLRRAIQSISSLISLTYSIKIFAGKWKTITAKLEELNAGLAAVGDEAPVVHSGVLGPTMATIHDCHDLARRCVDLSYSGKLLMQSDLDKLAGKIDLHAGALSEIYRDSGALKPQFAIVVSKPGSGACRDDVRFYVRDLMTRMRVGDADMKLQALKSLYDSVSEETNYVKVMIEQTEVLGLLIEFLESNDAEIQEVSAKIVALVAAFGSCKGALIVAGVIAPLIRVLECGSDIGREGAARSLMRLTENGDNGWSISAHGGVTALLKLCENGESFSGGGLVGAACGVLKNLVGVEEIKRFMVDEGAVETFVKLVRSREEGLQINAIEFLQNVACGDEGVRSLVIKEGGIRALMKLSEPKSDCSCKVREIALRAIENLCFCCASSVAVLIKYGFVDHLMHFLKNGEVSSQELALKVAIRLCEASEEAKKVMGDVNFMTELVKFLDSKSFEVREMAAEALSSMVSNPKNRKRFVQDDRNIGLLLQRFDPDQLGNAGNKKFLFSILMSLTSCHSGRRKIAHSRYLKNIEKLADAEVTDAKKLVKKLSTNRFRSMLSGLWHSGIHQ